MMTNQVRPYYRPWQESLLNLALAHARHDLFMLDVQLGSSCDACCPRCDSACRGRGEPAELDVAAVARLTKEMHEERELIHTRSGGHDGELPPIQGYICGLGEPTANENLTVLKQLLRETTANWAMFTNGLYWDYELSEYLRAGRLAVQVQHDSNRVESIMRLMGIDENGALAHLEHRRAFYKIAKETQSADGGTNVCGAIVPMQINRHELFYLIGSVIANGSFPLLTELEESGDCIGEYYSEQKIEWEDLLELHKLLYVKYGWYYEVPVCPAVIGALHIDNRNQVTVDAMTGWSCGWPMMRETERAVIGDIRKLHYRELADAAIRYRQSRLGAVRKELRKLNQTPGVSVFGGCGGKMRKLIELYLAAMTADRD